MSARAVAFCAILSKDFKDFLIVIYCNEYVIDSLKVETVVRKHTL